MWNWTSGASSPSRVRTKAPPSPPLEVTGPRPSASYCSIASGVIDEIRLPLSVRQTKLSITWSWRFWPDRQLVEGLHPQGRQRLGGPHARQHEQLRRVIGAGGQDDLALGADLLEPAVAHVLDADGALALEEDPVDARVGEDVDVAARRGGGQIGDRGAAAPAVALGDLVAACPLLPGPVEVVVVWDAGLAGGLHPGLDHGVHRAAVADRQRAADAVVAIG